MTVPSFDPAFPPTGASVINPLSVSTEDFRTQFGALHDAIVALQRLQPFISESDAGRHIVVGSTESDFTTIQAAIDSITDSSASNRYTIWVRPGTYQEPITFGGKGYITLVSIVPHGALIDERDTGSLAVSGTENTIRGFRIDWSAPSGGGGSNKQAIDKDGDMERIRFENCIVTCHSQDSVTTGERYCVRFVGNAATNSFDTLWTDCLFLSDHNLVEIANGNHYFRNCFGWLTGNGTHDQSQYGVRLVAAGRVRWDGAITTGYAYPIPDRTNGDIICFYIPEANEESGARMEVFQSGMASFARNEASTVGRVVAAYAGNGHMRLIGGKYQGETPNDAGVPFLGLEGRRFTATEPANGVGGRLVAHGVDHNGIAGNVFGTDGAINAVAADIDGVTLDKEEIGLFVIDTSGGAATINLPFNNVAGRAISFVKSGANSLTVGRNGGTIDGATVDTVISADDQLKRFTNSADGTYYTG